jgi:hypothetical protein
MNYNNLITEFIGTCADKEIATIAEQKGRKVNYKKLVKHIKDSHGEIYHTLALYFYNPYSKQCKLVTYENERYIILVHSMIDFVFKIINDEN